MRELSLMADVNESAVKAIMNGRSQSPRGKTLQGIASALGITVTELIGEEGEPKLSITPEYSDAPQSSDPVEVLRERVCQLDAEIQAHTRQMKAAELRLDEVREMIRALSRHKPSIDSPPITSSIPPKERDSPNPTERGTGQKKKAGGARR